MVKQPFQVEQTREGTEIVTVRQSSELNAVRVLFKAYQDFLGIPLDFQDFEAEMANLPGKYSPPTGELYLALSHGDAVGCAAFYQMAEGICEIKRVYVIPTAQGLGLGKALFQRVLCDAKKLGYHYARLDSLKRLHKAAKLYHAVGFYEIAPYNINPHEDVYYMELDLEQYQ